MILSFERRGKAGVLPTLHVRERGDRGQKSVVVLCHACPGNKVQLAANAGWEGDAVIEIGQDSACGPLFDLVGAAAGGKCDPSSHDLPQRYGCGRLHSRRSLVAARCPQRQV